MLFMDSACAANSSLAAAALFGARCVALRYLAHLPDCFRDLRSPTRLFLACQVHFVYQYFDNELA